MATTINYVVRKTQRKDGTYAVNIRIIHNREMRRLPTSVYLTKGQLSRDLNTIKDVKSEEIVQTRVMELRARLNEVSHADMMGIDQLVAIITRPTTECFRLDIFVGHRLAWDDVLFEERLARDRYFAQRLL